MEDKNITHERKVPADDLNLFEYQTINGKPILIFNIVDGRVVASYDEKDLDEAAKRFIAYMHLIQNQ